MSLVGKTRPRRLHRLTSFSIVTARAGAACDAVAFSTDKEIPPRNSVATAADGGSYPLTEPNNFGRDAAAYCDFENRYGARNIDQVTRQRRAARIYHQRRSKARDAFEMAMPHHQHVHDSAEMPMHRTLENLVRRLIRRRQRMGEADPHPLDLQQMCDAHPCVGIELEAMAIEALVAIAQCRHHRRNLCQI